MIDYTIGMLILIMLYKILRLYGLALICMIDILEDSSSEIAQRDKLVHF